MTPKPSTTEITVMARSLVIPMAPRTGSMRWATAGSPTQPSPSEAIVIPTWHTER
jgi:hypothetical protein